MQIAVHSFTSRDRLKFVLVLNHIRLSFVGRMNEDRDILKLLIEIQIQKESLFFIILYPLLVEIDLKICIT